MARWRRPGRRPRRTSVAAARDALKRLSDTLGQPVVADNRPGAGGNIGTDLVAKAPADGYTLLLATEGTLGINPSRYKRLPFDPAKDFTPIASFASVPNIPVVNPKVPVLSKAISEISQEPATTAKILNIGATPLTSTPSEFGQRIRSAREK
ncbi:tripartite tricarboxylate transporter family receptor domain protein [Bordetella hinzii CA90 BAL1384]|uniref:Tripartite tricarboxylate transporter family receptor domain protein n=1 Tax=Bordetella hinzii OH87 BAL007II TaxID=1331262 RepID=A0ABR4R6T8_9BORD|nr:tripartite tricarboxylate transporter family receptor domain protein [Bordetella hinzii OH87 BAL007II]KCB29650.1 tripartite tricarboxylate transporter family receptor domain protein [Bordetella hinzii CA90 BAL1384]KCB40855.1 tripartite tricarboxylate transporter family receptor domain protein [Bordetella hinzii 5132]